MGDFKLPPDLTRMLAGLQSQVAALERRIYKPEPHFVGDAGEPAFTNAWVNFDAAAPPTGRHAHFYRDRGRVYLGGLIKTGASAAIAFTLPAGYLPWTTIGTGAIVVPVFASGGIAVCQINTSGAVLVVNQGATAVTTFCYLDGVSFRHL